MKTAVFMLGMLLCANSGAEPSLPVAVPKEPFQAPRVREITLPEIAGTDGVWGALGRDDKGRILIGVSGHRPGSEPHVLRYDPDADTVTDLGSPMAALRAAGLARDGEVQNKIHSRFVPGPDGALYFASMDETGESQAEEVSPRWGGHLWRLAGERWEHLAAVPEALLAVGSGGGQVYALGYFGHVLYVWNGRSLDGIKVGAAGGHISRNLLVDARGHAYVPRLTATGKSANAELVEFDAGLKELASSPLPDYLGRISPADNHGITGLVSLADGGVAFTTHRGQLYRLSYSGDGPASLQTLGWFHPDGEAYVPGLFTYTGQRLIAGIAHRAGTPGFDWVVYDLKSGINAAFALDVGRYQDLLLYGSQTHDDRGRFYVGGWTRRVEGKAQRPLLLQLTPR